MAASTKVWANGLAPSCEDDDLNGFKAENNNLIVGAGISLNTSDNQQTHKAVAHYAGVGDYYVDSGTANTYVLGVTGVQVAPPTLAVGQRIRFMAGNANTGASTVNVVGSGARALIRDVPGTVPLLAGDIQVGRETRAYYDGSFFRVTSAKLEEIILDTPYSSGGGASVNTWVTSTAGTIAVNANAVAVKLRILEQLTGSAINVSGTVHLRKTGSGLTNDILTQVVTLRDAQPSTLARLVEGSVECTVNLNASHNFDWYHDTVGATPNVEIVVVAYYV